MNIDFTGTRNGLTNEQKAALWPLIATDPLGCFHHGACVGADEDAAVIASKFDLLNIVAHPGKSAHGGVNEHLSQKALDVSHHVCPTKTHFARNREIVDDCTVLIACPGYNAPITNSTQGGTAYTVNCARKRGKPVLIVRPNGSVEREGV